MVLLVLLAYLPALNGGFVWDDDSWTTALSALFQNTAGLCLMCFRMQMVSRLLRFRHVSD